MVPMDEDIIIDNKIGFYGEDFLDELLSKDYDWPSLLDGTDASPSEILADAAPILVPPISPVLSIKSSQGTSNSDSSSDDDSKNGSNTSTRQSSNSPCDWTFTLDQDPPNNLKLEDVELFLHKTGPSITQSQTCTQSLIKKEKRPVMAIENGIIKGIKTEIDEVDTKPSFPPTHRGDGHMQNAYFKVVNENSLSFVGKEENQVDFNNLVVQQNSLLHKQPQNITSNLVSPIGQNGKITIKPLFQPKYVKTRTIETSYHVKVEPSGIGSPVVINTNPSIQEEKYLAHVQNGDACLTKPMSPDNNVLDLCSLSENEIRALKKQQRMIKNRESACQSRQKKKEYVTALEHQLSEAHQEIARLRLENKLLRDQLNNNGRSRKLPRLDSSILIPKKNIAVIFAMVFMVSLNWNVLGWSSKPFLKPSPMKESVGRHLLWADENIELADSDQITNSSYDCQNMTNPVDFMYINQTESIRIAGDLSRWIKGGKTLNLTENSSRRKRSAYVSEEKLNGGLLETYKLFSKLNLEANIIDFHSTKNQGRNIRDKSRLRRLKRNKDIEYNDNAVMDYDLYTKPLRKSINDINMDDFGEWNSLLQALDRRDDTFYVVGVGKGEHLLLPAVSHNVTRPPKMALILPARNGNDSILSDHVTLMQIDCSVMNTTLVKLRSDALPESLRKTTQKTHKPDYGKIENKTMNKDTIDASLSKVLQNASNNLPNNVPNRNKISTNLDYDIMSNYLFSKEDLKPVKRIQKVKRVESKKSSNSAT